MPEVDRDLPTITKAQYYTKSECNINKILQWGVM